MIVKYMRERGYVGARKDPYLTLGKDYVVLRMTYSSYHNEFDISLLGDEEDIPGEWSLKFFDVVDGHIPEEWNLRYVDNKIIIIEPNEFGGNFWELFHDGDKEAAITFQAVLNKIRRFHDLPIPSMKKFFAEQLLAQMAGGINVEKLSEWAKQYNPDAILEKYKEKAIDPEIQKLLNKIEIMDLHADLVIPEEQLRTICLQWIEEGIINIDK